MNGWRVIWGRRERSGLRFPRSIGEISGDYRDDGGDNEQIDNCENDHHGENQPEQKIIGQSSSEVTSEQQRQRLSTSDIRTITQSRTTSEPTKSINFQSPANSGPSLIHIPSTRSDYTIPPKSNYPIRISTQDSKSNTINLQPDAIYEEYYGDAYVNQLLRSLETIHCHLWIVLLALSIHRGTLLRSGTGVQYLLWPRG